jgi:formate dehydrogenase maturation protein FdhE
MSNTKTVPNCPNCNTIGTVVRHIGIFVNLDCPCCKTKWQTLSEKCPSCGKSNGFAVKGECGKCYSARY